MSHSKPMTRARSRSRAAWVFGSLLLVFIVAVFALALRDGDALTMTRRGLALQGAGRYEEAEPLLQRALGISEKALGPDHPDVGTTLHNLAGLYQDQGRYEEAEPLYQRALGIREEALGPDHPTTRTVRENLDSLAAERVP